METESKNQEEKIKKQKLRLWEKFLWGVTAVGFNTTLGIIRIIPERFLPILGNWLGSFWYYVMPSRQKIARENIKRVYGSKFSAKEIRSLAKAVFKNISRDMIEVGISYVSAPDPRFLKKNISVQGIENLDNALKKGKG